MTPSWPARALMAVVRGYRLMLSPWLGNACRFEPTCSRYSLAALEKHGALPALPAVVRRRARPRARQSAAAVFPPRFSFRGARLRVLFLVRVSP
jgi:putative membrane protein insertion efficiency factor